MPLHITSSKHLRGDLKHLSDFKSLQETLSLTCMCFSRLRSTLLYAGDNHGFVHTVDTSKHLILSSVQISAAGGIAALESSSTGHLVAVLEDSSASVHEIQNDFNRVCLLEKGFVRGTLAGTGK